MTINVTTYETLKIEWSDGNKGIVLVTLNRPEALNAMNTKMAIELIEFLKSNKDDETIRTIIITGAGSKSFCVGADLKERNGMSKKDWKKQHDYFERVTELIRSFPVPVIAGINGYAMGGGLEIALSCDVRTSSDQAQMALPESTLGIIPGIGGTQLISRILPIGIAKEMLFTGRKMKAAEAKQWGLVNNVFPQENFLEETIQYAQSIAKNAPLSLKSLKKVVDRGIETDLSTGLAFELEGYYQCANSEDRLEGISAFNEKRSPEWKGK